MKEGESTHDVHFYSKEEKKNVAEQRKQISIEKDGKTYQLIMPFDATIGSAYDACHAILSSILEIAKEAVEKAAPKEVE